MRHLLAVLHLRPGEARTVLYIAIVGAAYAAATSLGDDIAQSVFVARAGAEALPRLFLFKGALDIFAAAIYLPLTRGRSAAAVWRVALAIYLVTVAGGWWWASGGTVVGAYGLYVLHESAWTILTIHWAVLMLEIFDANQAKRLFPILFAATRLGGIGAGTALGYLAARTSALNLLGLCAAFAATAGALTWLPRVRTSPSQKEARRVPFREAGRAIASSTLVRAIAYSTAAMVFVRYGLRMVSMEEINVAHHYDEDMVAEFLGKFRVWANTVGAVLGIFVMPRLMTWVGVGAINLTYAFAAVAAYAGLIVAPSVATAAAARFVEQQFKDAAKTPLSALFYGAEPAHLRSAARALMFGSVIPAATAVTALSFDLTSERGDVGSVAIIGAVLAVAFVGLSHLLTVRWRQRIRRQLSERLAVAPPPDPARVELLRAQLSYDLAMDHSGAVEAAIHALAAADSSLAALGEEVLAESTSRRRAHRVAVAARGTK